MHRKFPRNEAIGWRLEKYYPVPQAGGIAGDGSTTIVVLTQPNWKGLQLNNPMNSPLRTCCLTVILMAAFAHVAAADEGRESAQAPGSRAGWSETRVLEAPEAFQAAAAHEDGVFAITNSQIAKYDRTSGKRLAVSTGEAQHLNSGFVGQGKLYCAHSNYPRVPEKSEIKVLDLETMRLTTFKDFGNFGGSLTWAVRHSAAGDSDAWWCNFARYGDENAKTFLVKLDDEWREQGRWTYPPEVLKEIGSASLSGGLWQGDSLLVTDHDHPAIYRLRLPDKGDVLEFIGKEPVPFTGQGFASDAHTGGLIGINRAKRQIIFAEPAKP